jgi:DNA (cytosine-5)-methyltransferase 1
MDESLPTQTTENRFGLILPHLQRQFGHSVGHAANEPCGTTMAGDGGKTALVASFLAQHNGGSVGHEANEPLSTIVHRGTQQQIVMSWFSGKWNFAFCK